MTIIHAGWIERELQASDVERVLELRRMVFPEDELDKVSPAFWGWEFRDNPAGPAIIHVGEVEGDLAAHVAVIPARWRLDGRDQTTSISVDVMTHPRHRRKRIFATLNKNTLLAAGQQGIPFTYAFDMREEALPGALGIGFEKLMSLPVLAKPTSFRRVLRRWLKHDLLCLLGACLARPTYRLYCLGRRKPQPDREVAVHEVAEFDDRFTKFFEQACAPHEIIQVRDAEYLTWRYLRNPARSYRILVAEKQGALVGFAVLRCCEVLGLRAGMLVDLLCLPGQSGAAQRLLCAAEEILARDKVDLIGYLGSEDDAHWALLRGNGYLRSPYAYHFIVHVNRDDFVRETIWDSRKWFLTWGDTDVM